ncbi:neuroendocrine convertase 1-like isoform X2 [Rhodnius prolixus]|uniref:neuroendocrine convertase 1-like isoform X2 n=1 Tax=Rhodnius prolixus TaxID=13249 RepID=UPI003D18D60C
MDWTKVLSACTTVFYVAASYSLTDPDIWVAKITGGPPVAQLIATVYGYQLLDKWHLVDDTYLLKKINSSSARKRTTGKLVKNKRVEWVEKQVPKKRSKRGIFSWLQSRYRRVFNDELWDKEWYIDPEISYDFNENDMDPTPRYDNSGTNSHGTKCAGEISMTANNHVCGVGIAYQASLGGIKILDGPPTDLLESSALGYKMDKIDVFSNSWGPADDGKAMDEPGRLLTKVLYKGITEGRNGKGIIYIFASGNGKFHGDNCGADGYINSIFTVPVASASQEGKAVYYGERCAAIMATAYSSGSPRNEMIATTNLNNSCTVRHSGTSAAAPLAAGIAALVLQANPELTWRDFQHLIAWTSEVAVLGANPDWILNGAGYWVNRNFGFGLLNAFKLVTMARQMKTVPSKSICIIPIKLRGNTTLVKGSEVNVRIYTTGCEGMQNEINFLEHVELKLSVKYPRRGSLSVYLTSPSGTPSIMLEERFKDSATSGLRGWTMSTVHCWGENPRGIWTVTVRTRENEEEDYIAYVGEITSALVRLHGTKIMPLHYEFGPRKYEPL